MSTSTINDRGKVTWIFSRIGSSSPILGFLRRLTGILPPPYPDPECTADGLTTEGQGRTDYSLTGAMADTESDRRLPEAKRPGTVAWAFCCAALSLRRQLRPSCSMFRSTELLTSDC